MSAKRAFFYSLLVLSLFLSGCAMFGDSKDAAKKKPSMDASAQKLLDEGMEEYRYGKYFSAVKSFEEIVNRYPFSRQAIEAEIKAADCSYHLEQYKEAESLYTSFENNHPTNAALPYVLYQKAMCNYRQIDRVDRDPSGAEKAVRYFKQLLRAFPDSPYTADAKEKIVLATDFLANHEFSIVQFYLRTGNTSQAKTRLEYILATYPQSSVAEKSRQLLQKLKKKEKGEEKSSFFSWF